MSFGNPSPADVFSVQFFTSLVHGDFHCCSSGGPSVRRLCFCKSKKTPTFFSPKLTSSARWFKSSPVAATQNTQTHHHVSHWSPHPRPPCGHLWRRRARIARAHALICDAVLRTERMRLRQEVCRRLQSLQCAAQSSSTSFSPLHRFLLFFFQCARHLKICCSRS